MKKLLLTLLLLTLCLFVYPQFGLKIYHIRPTGKFGMEMKPSAGGELIYKPFSDHSKLNIRGCIGFTTLKPRLDSFPVYGYVDGSFPSVEPGYKIIHSYRLITFHIGLVYTIDLSEKLKLYPGFDYGYCFSKTSYRLLKPPSPVKDLAETGFYTSFRIYGGLEYFLKDEVGLFLEATRSFNYSAKYSWLTYNDYGLGLRIHI